jgi:O-antigen ligase
VAPMRLISDSIGSTPWTAWIGHGPGTITRLGDASLYRFHDPTWAKALFEYGLIGFGLVVALAVVTLRHAAVPIQVRAAAFFCWLATGGFLLTPEALLLLLVFAGLIPKPSQDARPAVP